MGKEKRCGDDVGAFGFVSAGKTWGITRPELNTVNRRKWDYLRFILN